MKKKPDSDSEKPVRLGIQPAALGYLSLMVIAAVAWGAGKVFPMLLQWLEGFR